MTLTELINEARVKGKWLWCRYQDLWFSPEQLEAQNADGKFRWGVDNFELRDPQEYIEEARRRAEFAQETYERLKSLRC
jgi:hypothetical protein